MPTFQEDYVPSAGKTHDSSHLLFDMSLKGGAVQKSAVITNSPWTRGAESLSLERKMIALHFSVYELKIRGLCQKL